MRCNHTALALRYTYTALQLVLPCFSAPALHVLPCPTALATPCMRCTRTALHLPCITRHLHCAVTVLHYTALHSAAHSLCAERCCAQELANYLGADCQRGAVSCLTGPRCTALRSWCVPHHLVRSHCIGQCCTGPALCCVLLERHQLLLEV
jgi:hypothetical protein